MRSIAGKNGLPGVNQLCYSKAHYAFDKIINIDGFTPLHDKNFIKEFCIKTKFSASRLKRDAEKDDIYIGIIMNDKSDSIIQIAVTEKRTLADINKLCNFFSNYNQ